MWSIHQHHAWHGTSTCTSIVKCSSWSATLGHPKVSLLQQSAQLSMSLHNEFQEKLFSHVESQSPPRFDQKEKISLCVVLTKQTHPMDLVFVQIAKCNLGAVVVFEDLQDFMLLHQKNSLIIMDQRKTHFHVMAVGKH